MAPTFFKPINGGLLGGIGTPGDDDNFRVIGQETGRIIQFGDEVRIRVKAVDLFKHRMDFELLADTLPKKSRQKRRF